MKLTEEQERMLGGEYGPGRQKALDMLVKCGETFDAERMVEVDSAHIFSTDPLEFVRKTLEGVDELNAFTTLMVAYAFQSEWCSAIGIRSELAEPEIRVHKERVNLLKKAGAYALFSCAPYLVGNMVRKGAIFSWPGSSGIIIANSLFGGRGNRDAAPTALCSAITGFTPEMLLHKSENRHAELIVNIEDIDLEEMTEADFGALGYYIGLIAGSRNVGVVGHFPRRLPFEKLKYFLSPMPVSGAVSLCHIVGVTPEAPTLEAALGGMKPPETIRLGKKELDIGFEKLNTADNSQVDAVCLGCPHCSISEIKEIARLLDGKRVSEGTRLWISTAEGIYHIARQMGYVDIIENAGGQIFTGICIMSVPFRDLEIEMKASATNSARCAHYQARGGVGGGSGVNVFYGSTAQCITAALTGKWEGR